MTTVVHRLRSFAALQPVPLVSMPHTRSECTPADDAFGAHSSKMTQCVGFYRQYSERALYPPTAPAAEVDANLRLPWPQLDDVRWIQQAGFREALRRVQDKLAIESCVGAGRCRLCGKNLGKEEVWCDEYIWPRGWLHYFEHHRMVCTDSEFVWWILTRAV